MSLGWKKNPAFGQIKAVSGLLQAFPEGLPKEE
jgi:hypothetical protein